MNIVKVVVFRNETDRLFRLANNHYHACVGVREVESWQGIATRVLSETSDLVCKRASPYDQQQWAEAVQSLKDSVTASVERLARLKNDQATMSKRPNLRVISPCESYSHSDRIH
jgi:hypothetical protein